MLVSIDGLGESAINLICWHNESKSTIFEVLHDMSLYVHRFFTECDGVALDGIVLVTWPIFIIAQAGVSFIHIILYGGKGKHLVCVRLFKTVNYLSVVVYFLNDGSGSCQHLLIVLQE